ncbi:MAG TPA: iron-sulfur cluster assembly scaffold protein [Pyrinomonadaceae bacterium]|jgi:NifU-like protein|nr:iron-sulfur cluster assembly scaffold protein [Pyrinomonadaceae bacterium]
MKSGIIICVQCNPGLVSEIFFNPKHVGEATEPSFVGRAASFQCGATLRLSLHVDESQRIRTAKFKAAGCSVLVASASLLIDQVLGKTTAEAAALGQDPAAITEQLGYLPEERIECVTLAGEALLSAIRNYSGSVRDDWEGDEALICTCFCVSERTIEREIQTNNLKSIAEVTAACSAGGGCRSCYPLIEDILEEVNGKW